MQMGWKNSAGGAHIGWIHAGNFPSGRFSLRVADAQTGRPYSGSITPSGRENDSS
jgi:hypothetical protein